MIDVAEKQTSSCSVDDQPEIVVDAKRPEIHVLGFIELVKAETRIRGIELQVKGCRFDSLLLLARQTREAISEGVSHTEVHKEPGHYM